MERGEKRGAGKSDFSGDLSVFYDNMEKEIAMKIVGASLVTGRTSCYPEVHENTYLSSSLAP